MNVDFMQPYLTGETISLRPLERDDFEPLFKSASDPLIWAGHPAKTRYQKDEFSRWFDASLASGGALVIQDTMSNQLIGSSRYYSLDEAKSEIAIGFTFLARSHWGGATNRELKKLMLQHAFGKVETVWFHVDVSNIRSQKAMEKIGGVVSHIGEIDFNGSVSTYMFFRIKRTAD